MNKNDYIFTSESVSEGHPDKVADQISDGILDAHLAGDPNSRVAIETLVTTNRIILSGEITSGQAVDYEKIARDVVREIGYTDPKTNFTADSSEVNIYVHSQSADISQGVTAGEGLHKEQGAGDQGMMFGYAVAETDSLMPMPIHLAHRLVERLADLRKDGTLPFVKPDSKSQVTVQYENDRPKRLDAIVVSTMHDEDVTLDKLNEAIRDTLIRDVVPPGLVDNNTRIYVNPTGRFVIGGPDGDTGLTGRKIIVDTYGGMGRHGGGAFSGKDPSKVDRSAAYMGRYVAKNIVAAGLAHRCEVHLSYAIGVAEPISILVETFGTSTVDDNEIAGRVREVFDMKPAGIIRSLDLLRPIYKQTAAYGHFGREDQGFRWEMTDKKDQLK